MIIIAPTFPLNTFSVLGSTTHQGNNSKTGLLITKFLLQIQRFPRSSNKISKENIFLLEVYSLESSPAAPDPAIGLPPSKQCCYCLVKLTNMPLTTTNFPCSELSPSSYFLFSPPLITGGKIRRVMGRDHDQNKSILVLTAANKSEHLMTQLLGCLP